MHEEVRYKCTHAVARVDVRIATFTTSELEYGRMNWYRDMLVHPEVSMQVRTTLTGMMTVRGGAVVG